MNRLIPFPLASLAIAVIWVMLANEITPGNIVMGSILGLLIPPVTSRFTGGEMRLKAPFTAIGYVLMVLWDIVVANIHVAGLILFRRADSLRSVYVTVPLELTTAHAITIFAGTISMTPGTVSADLSADGRSLLVHCLDTADPDATIAQLKRRYERPLKKMYE